MNDAQVFMRHSTAATQTSHNKWGYRGVEWSARKGKFRARIHNMGRAKSLGYYSTAEDAARAYDEAAREKYGALAHLNFPQPGEKGIRPSRLFEGFCPEGHPLIEFGSVDAKGTIQCRKCNVIAALKYRARLRGKDWPSQPVAVGVGNSDGFA